EFCTKFAKSATRARTPPLVAASRSVVRGHACGAARLREVKAAHRARPTRRGRHEAQVDRADRGARHPRVGMGGVFGDAGGREPLRLPGLPATSPLTR